MDPKVPEAKIAEASALWEIALLYIALGAAARTIRGGAAASGAAASGGYRASQLLARAYYRLMRAIWTGSTIADRADVAGGTTSLRDLYSDFETLAYRSIPESKHEETRERVRRAGHNWRDAMEDDREEHDIHADLDSDEERYSDDQELVDASENVTENDGDDYAADETEDRDWTDDADIDVEDLEDAEEHLRQAEEAERKELERLEREIEKIERDAKRMAQKQKRAAKQKKRQQAAKDRGRRAGAAMKAAQQGARTEIASLTSRDGKALGWVSAPKGQKPCYWCMMLASRGLMLYTTDMNATSYSDLWHNNCKCVTIPVFSRDEYFTSPVFERNRTAYNLWRDYRRKGGGRVNPTDWRKHFDSTYRNGGSYEDINRDHARTD